jgi:hypothetical protein
MSIVAGTVILNLQITKDIAKDVIDRVEFLVFRTNYIVFPLAMTVSSLFFAVIFPVE